ncbi:hypothetical protein EW026_g1993 [Hermanssonia centrifuga]|uniref:DNA replication regulator Sld3 C-terminal domain-containing protein n=1 Tax=Hermanssonia centrifuga TaxID=98765 RepID=A0A4S4KQN2_9APHY|nr:hypothetical protein EW026_g1993 [Hermanssonia centrifuga]
MSVSPRKRKRGSRDAESSDAAAAAITPSLEERLEALMDKLSIWQLMGSIDNAVGGDETQRKPSSAWKGKQKAGDERDWMQTFCEDVVAPLFRGSLPSQCALLHDKVFQSSPFSDGSDTLSPSASPPPSPRQKEKQLNTEATSTKTASRSRGPQGLTRTSSSLSITLEEERVRERSKSLSIGPGQIRKRAVTREISMTTAFKGKAAKAKKPGPSAKDKTREGRRDEEKRGGGWSELGKERQRHDAGYGDAREAETQQAAASDMG